MKAIVEHGAEVATPFVVELEASSLMRIPRPDKFQHMFPDLIQVQRVLLHAPDDLWLSGTSVLHR